MSRVCWAAATVVLVLAAGCAVELDRAQEGFPCEADSSCVAGLSCVEGICVHDEGEDPPDDPPNGPPACADERVPGCVCEAASECPAPPACARAVCDAGVCGAEVVGCWSIEAADDVLPANGEAETWITVSGRDGDDVGLPGRSVTLQTDAGSLVGEVVDEGDGRYRQRLRAPAEDAEATVSYSVDGSPGPFTVNVRFVVLDEDGPTLLVGGYPSPWYAGEPGAVTARVLGPDGAAISFTGSLVVESDAGDAVLPEPVILDDATGPIRIEGIAFPSSGNFRVTVRDGDDSEISGSQPDIRVTAASVSLSSTPAWALPDGEASLFVEAELRDAAGALVEGAEVVFFTEAPDVDLTEVNEVGAGRHQVQVTRQAPGRFEMGLTVDGLPFDDRIEVCFGVACEARFSERRRLTLDNDSGETLTDVPILVILDESRIDYDRTRAGGTDLRFVDARHAAFLSHEIVRWEAGGTSYVWLRVPLLPTGETTVWMYYGDATLDDGQDTAAVWDAGFSAVWHLAEDPTADEPWMLDSTGRGNHALYHPGLVDPVANGPLGPAIRLDGTESSTDWLEVPLSESLALDGEAFTLEAWALVDEDWGEDDQAFVQKSPNDDNARYFVGIGRRGQTVSCRVHTENDGVVRTDWDDVDAPTRQFSLGAWMYFVCRYDGTELVGFIDGDVVDNRRLPVSGAVVDGVDDELHIGRRQGQRRFGGLIDEVRISSVARSDAWIAVQYRSARDALIAYGPAQSVD